LDGISRPEFISEERRGVDNGITCLDAGFGGVARSRFDFKAVFALVKLETERLVNINLNYRKKRRRRWWWLEEMDREF
jgi:hypothetical protein